MPPASHSDESLRYLRALGDPDRLHIVQALRAGPKTVGEICEALRSPMANVSHHLRMLKDAGVVSARKRGRFVIYRLNHAVADAGDGMQALDFGCCRVEFSERRQRGGSKGVPASLSSPTGDQALLILNRILAQAPSARTPRAAKHPRTRGADSREIKIINPSFEHPATAFFDTAVAGWAKEGDPNCTGVFRNFPDDTPLPGSRMIRNADAMQLATLAAQNPGPGRGGAPALFQELSTTYRAGTGYVLSVSVGVSSVQPPTGSGGRGKTAVPPTLRFGLTFTDVAGRRRELVGRSVAAKEVPSPERLVHFSVATTVPRSRPPHACVGRRIGILITTADNSPAHSGHFIVDGVALAAESAPPKQRSASRALPQRSNVR